MFGSSSSFGTHPVNLTAEGRPHEGQFDAIDVIEAAYRLDGDDATWLRSLARAARLDFGFGGSAYVFERISGRAEGVMPGYAIPTLVVWNAPPAYVEHLPQEIVRVPPDWPHRAHPPHVAIASVSETEEAAGFPNHVRRRVKPTGLADALGVFVNGGTDCGLAILGHSDRVLRSIPVERRLWAKLAPHLSAGLRLRRLGEPLSLESPDVEAVLAPSGRCLEACGEATTRSARHLLHEMALRIDRARSAGHRSSNEEVLALWQELVAGRWSLVEQFDSDGRRFLVARRNEPETSDPRQLSTREREVAWLAAAGLSNKDIAHELRISQPAVSLHLNRIRRKLGIASVMELRSFAPHAPDDQQQGSPSPRPGSRSFRT